MNPPLDGAPIKHRDFLGNPLYVGDLILVIENDAYSGHFGKAVVVGETPLSIKYVSEAEYRAYMDAKINGEQPSRTNELYPSNKLPKSVVKMGSVYYY
jgi:hypothetical protein